MDCIYRLLDGVDCAVNKSTEVLIGYPPLVRLGMNSFQTNLSPGRKAIVSLLSKIKLGKLTVRTGDNVYEFGCDGTSGVELTVLNDAFWSRLFLSGDLVCFTCLTFSKSKGFAAAYMEGDVICDDLVALFKVGPANPSDGRSSLPTARILMKRRPGLRRSSRPWILWYTFDSLILLATHSPTSRPITISQTTYFPRFFQRT